MDKVISFDDRDDSACGAIYKTLATHGREPKLYLQTVAIEQIQQHPEFKTYGDTPG